MADTFYAIRQKSTGFYMPDYAGRAGGTWEEPSATKPPRLFRRKQDAKCALEWWLGGHVRGHYDHEGCFDDLTFIPVPSRRVDDMEVVAVTIIVTVQ